MTNGKSIRIHHKCPWKAGSLLAYRIISSDSPYVTSSPFYGKYVLLRVIKILRERENAENDDLFREAMLVGLYNWWGDTIPDARIVKNLEFTPIRVDTKPLLNKTVIQAIDNAVALNDAISRLSSPCVRTCCRLDWKCLNGIKTEDIFHLVDCDDQFVPGDFFKTDLPDYSFSHSIPFDARLVTRLSQLYPKVDREFG